MLTLEEARDRVLAAVTPHGRETAALSRAAERILAERIVSPLDLPPFDNTSMDGYAVRSADVQSAAPDRPVALRVIGRTEAGGGYAGTLIAGTAVRVFTGSPMPAGADAVVMQEDTRVSAAQPGSVDVLAPVGPRESVRFRGGDLPAGAVVGEIGQPLTPGRLSLLASIGLSVVQVGQQPFVALLATGSELVEAGQARAPGQIYDSNRTMLAALVARTGAIPRIQPIVRDTLAATEAALECALRDCEMVITSGGVSVGETDFVKAAFERLGGRIDLWKVAMRPGRPFVFGRWRDRFLFGLPGNPASALVTFLLLVRPALIRWQGGTVLDLPTHPGVLAEPLVNDGERRHFMRVAVDAAGRVRLAGLQGSHAVSSLAEANGLVDVAPATAWAAGTPVTVLRIG